MNDDDICTGGGGGGGGGVGVGGSVIMSLSICKINFVKVS